MTPRVRFLPPAWETCIELLVPDIDPGLALNLLGIWTVNQEMGVISSSQIFFLKADFRSSSKSK